MKEESWPKDSICDPPTPAQTCMNVLIDRLLGPDWYVSISENGEQTNTAAVYDILRQYVDEKHSIYMLTAISIILNIIMFFMLAY